MRTRSSSENENAMVHVELLHFDLIRFGWTYYDANHKIEDDDSCLTFHKTRLQPTNFEMHNYSTRFNKSSLKNFFFKCTLQETKQHSSSPPEFETLLASTWIRCQI